MVSAPLLQRRWWASKGDGAWTGRSLLKATPCQVSDVTPARGRLAVLLLARRLGRARPARRLPVADARRCWRTRAYGDFWSYMLLAEGAVDIAAEPELERLRHGGARRHRPRGRRPVHLARRHRRTVRAATRWPPTATCTTRRCRSSARCPTTTTTPTGSRTGPGSVSTALRAAVARDARRTPSAEPESWTIALFSARSTR